MDFYDKLINVRGTDIQEGIKESISGAKSYYKDLTKDRMCYVYSSKVYENLKNKGVSSYLISTSDLGIDYEHYFVIVPFAKDKYYLVDITYEQFLSDGINSIFDDLLSSGYMELTSDVWNQYIKSICVNSDISFDDIIFDKRKK